MTAIGTATAYAGESLHAPVAVLRRYTSGGVERADVVTQRGGVGGWATPGKHLTVTWAMVRDFTPPAPVVAPAPARMPAPAEQLQSIAERLADLNIPEPAGELTDEQRATVQRLRGQLVATVTELVATEVAIVNDFQRPPGSASMRGKQHNIRVDASIRRAAERTDKFRRLESAIKGLVQQIAAARRPPLPPITPESIRTAKFIRDRYGWHKVVRVNPKTVSVATGYSWTDRISHSKVLEVR